ncbi:MAG: hypothetical protein R3C15_10895 [Thermoleophilia bacterium]
MSPSTTSHRVQDALLDFAWSQWAQLGIFAGTDRRDGWTQDPEALIVFTLHVARRDPRLFDELLDWLRLNGRLVSGRRLVTICPAQDPDRAVLEATVAWAHAHGAALQITAGHTAPSAAEPLFPGVRARKPDPIFEAHGLLKPVTEPSRKSREPDVEAPINLAFRLRLHFGLGSSRADVVRFLLTSRAPDADALSIADAALFAKRNVNETLAALVAAGEVRRYARGNQGRYALDRDRWAAFLDLDVESIPTYVDWPRVLSVTREIDRWLADPRLDDLSDYMRSSEARALVDRLERPLGHLGIMVPPASGPDFWPAFEETVARVLERIAPVARAGSPRAAQHA